MAELRSRRRHETDEVKRQRTDLTKNLPATVLLSVLEWLAIPDLLATGTVDCSFRDLGKEELPWGAAACHLWKSALLDGQALLVEAAGIHETARAGEFLSGVVESSARSEIDANYMSPYASGSELESCVYVYGSCATY